MLKSQLIQNLNQKKKNKRPRYVPRRHNRIQRRRRIVQKRYKRDNAILS